MTDIKQVNDGEINKRLLNSLIKNKHFKLFRLSVLFTVLLLLFFAMPILMPSASMELFDGYSSFVVPYQAEVVDGRVTKKIVWIENVSVDDLQSFQLVAVNNQGTIWIEQISSVDYEHNQIVTTYDGQIARRYNFDDIEGIYNREANIFGVFYYFVSRPLGVLVMTVAFGASLVVGYFGFVKNLKTSIKKFKDNYEIREENI